MAKPDTVYSLFGMKTPQQVAAEQFKEAFSYEPGPSGYQRAGAGLGKLLTALLTPESEAVKRAKEGEAVLKSASEEVQARRAAEAEQQQQLRTLQGLQTTMPGVARPITAEEQARIQQLPENLSREDQMMRQFDQQANMYDIFAQQLEAGGFLTEAENARNKATEARLKVFGLQKTLAETKKAEAEAAKVDQPKAPTIKEFKIGKKIVTKQWTKDGWVTVATADRFQEPENKNIPTIKTWQEGNEEVTSQWNPSTNEWDEIARGPKKADTEVNVNTEGETALMKELGKGFSDDYRQYTDLSRKAEIALTNLDVMEGLLNDGIIAGPFAQSRLAVERALKAVGAIDGERVATTEAFLAAGAQQTLAILQTGAVGAGTGISDADREFIAKAAGGTITLDADSIRRIIRINKQVARNVFGQQRSVVKDIQETFPGQGSKFKPRFYNGERFNFPGIGVVTWSSTQGGFVDQNGNVVQQEDTQ